MKTLTLMMLLAGIGFSTSAFAGQAYDCDRVDFNTTVCEYTGTATLEDVQEYFADAKSVIDNLVDAYGFLRISYSPKPGRVIIYTSKDSEDFAVADVLAAFHNNNLRLENIVWTYPDTDLVAGNRVEVEGEPTKGTLRYNALKSKNNTVPYDLIMSVK